MIPDRLSADQIRAYEQQLLERVPADSPIGNVNLRSQLSQLGWNESQYWDIRNHLMARGVLVSGKGKGGSVRRVVPVRTSTSDIPVAGAPATTTDPIPAHAPDHLRKAENKLYVPMAETIRKGWAKDLGLDAFVVEITAYSGPKAGKWAHPDVTLASTRTFPYVPGRHFELVTFEIKPEDQVNVTAVYEALAHLRAATRSYVLLHVPHSAKSSLEPVIDEILSEAKQHGIGVIIAEQPDKYDGWEEKVEAVRREPDPARLNDFLAQQVSKEFREQVIRWLK